MELSIASRVVLVFGGDAAVGRALELSLKSADHDVRFLGETVSSEPGVLDKAELLILAPGLSTECHEDILALVGSRTEEARLPILRLLTNYQEEEQSEAGWFLPWPCRIEKLRQEIKVALL